MSSAPSPQSKRTLPARLARAAWWASLTPAHRRAVNERRRASNLETRADAFARRRIYALLHKRGEE